jgi:hypothetical protein
MARNAERTFDAPASENDSRAQGMVTPFLESGNANRAYEVEKPCIISLGHNPQSALQCARQGL